MIEPALLPRILREWRAQLETPMSLGEVAEAISALPGAKPIRFQTVATWESGKGRPGLARLRELDQVYRANGTLVALGTAVTTPASLPPRINWRLMVHGPSTGPVWVWIRAAHPGPIDAQLTVGPFRSNTSTPEIGSDGFMVVSPVSTSMQPFSVNLALPGWVDVGRGDIPLQLGFHIFDPVTPETYPFRVHMSKLKPATAVAAFRRRLAQHDQQALEKLDVEIDRLNLRRHLDTLIQEVTPRDQAPTDLGMLPQEPLPADWTARQIRDGRDMSWREVAAEVSAMPINLAGEPILHEVVRPHVIRDFEQGASTRATYLSARLDTAYALAGLLACDEIPVQQARSAALDKRARPSNPANIRYRLDFPLFWVGPIWIKFTSQTSSPEEIEVELVGYPWHKFIHLRSGQMVVTRRLWPRPGRADPFYVEIRAGWSISAGMGEPVGAANVERGWTVVDVAGQAQLLAELARGTHRYLATMIARSRHRQKRKSMRKRRPER